MVSTPVRLRSRHGQIPLTMANNSDRARRNAPVLTYCTRTRALCHLRVFSPTDRDGKKKEAFDKAVGGRNATSWKMSVKFARPFQNSRVWMLGMRMRISYFDVLLVGESILSLSLRRIARRGKSVTLRVLLRIHGKKSSKGHLWNHLSDLTPR